MAINLGSSFTSGLGGKVVSNMGGGGGGGYRKPTGPVPLSPQQELERQRKLSEDAIANVKGMYQSQATGQNQPYSPDVVSRLFGQASDLAAGQARGQSDLIRQSFARRGMSNSGGQMASLAGAQNRAAANLRRAQSQLQTQATLENYGAAERGRAGLAGLLGPELSFRSRYEVTGEDPLTAALAKLLAGGGGGRQILSSGGRGQPNPGYGFDTGWSDAELYPRAAAAAQQGPMAQTPYSPVVFNQPPVSALAPLSSQWPFSPSSARASALASAPDDLTRNIAQFTYDTMPGLGGL